MKERFTPRVAAYLVLLKDGRVLLSKRCNTGYMDGNYILVSGHLEKNEGITNTMIREAWEETGIILRKEDLNFAHVQHRNSPDSEYVDFFFIATKWEGEIINKEPDRCDELGWFALDNLPQNIIPSVKLALEQIALSKNYSEFGW